MKARIFVGGLHHESDTFNPIITTKEAIHVIRGQAMMTKRENSSSGIIHTLIAAGYEVIPSLLASAVPNGVWDRAYYEQLKGELLTQLKEAGPLDAICLSLHGSMRVQSIGEAEQDLLEAIRLLHPTTLLLASLDMHATLTRRMRKAADGFVGYKCAPHTDTYETGIHTALMAIRTLESGKRPTMAAVRIPMLIAGEQSETSVEPMRSLIRELRKREQEDGVLACSYLLGFPWADGTENAVHAVVVTQNDQEQADRLAEELASLFWNKRAQFGFYTEALLPEKAVEATKQSLRDGTFPVVISDSGDNPTAGSSADVTTFLASLLADPVLSHLDPPLLYQGFYDPEVVSAAIEAGVGNEIRCELGAKFDKRTSKSLKVNARVLRVNQDWQEANLVLLSLDGIEVVVFDRHVGCYDPEMMRSLGVEPTRRKVIVVKLGYLENEIRSISKRSILALTTGSSDELFMRLPYRNLPRPLYPLDVAFEAELSLI